MKIKFFYLISVFVIVFDLVTKAVTDNIIYAEAIPGLFSIESHHNTGASFSMFASSKAAQIIFIIMAFLFSAAIILFDIFNKKIETNAWFSVGATLMLGGTIGNLVDRLFLGYVRDFISLDFMDFAIFNVADTSLCVGVVCIAIWLIFFAKEKDKQNGNKEIKS